MKSNNAKVFPMFLRPLCYAVVVLALVPGSAHAYLDPGTGSYALQILLAAVFGALFTIKLYWQKLKNYFSGRKGGQDQDTDEK